MWRGSQNSSLPALAVSRSIRAISAEGGCTSSPRLTRLFQPIAAQTGCDDETFHNVYTSVWGTPTSPSRNVVVPPGRVFRTNTADAPLEECLRQIVLGLGAAHP